MLNATAQVLLRGLSFGLLWPVAALTLFGGLKGPYTFFAQALALAPGLAGDYARIAYYRLTLRRCPLGSRISFGSFFAHPESEVGEKVYIGAYCILGRCRIGDRTQIASQVQLLSGRRQHGRDPSGRLQGADHSAFERVEIGPDCWIGAAAVVMASVGAGATIGAGAVVVKEVPPGAVAVGNPARLLSEAGGASVSGPP